MPFHPTQRDAVVDERRCDSAGTAPRDGVGSLRECFAELMGDDRGRCCSRHLYLLAKYVDAKSSDERVEGKSDALQSACKTFPMASIVRRPTQDGVDVALRVGPLPDSSMVAIPVGSVCCMVCGSPACFGGPWRPENSARPAAHRPINCEAVSRKPSVCRIAALLSPIFRTQPTTVWLAPVCPLNRTSILWLPDRATGATRFDLPRSVSTQPRCIGATLPSFLARASTVRLDRSEGEK